MRILNPENSALSDETAWAREPVYIYCYYCVHSPSLIGLSWSRWIWSLALHETLWMGNQQRFTKGQFSAAGPPNIFFRDGTKPENLEENRSGTEQHDGYLSSALNKGHKKQKHDNKSHTFYLLFFFFPRGRGRRRKNRLYTFHSFAFS